MKHLLKSIAVTAALFLTACVNITVTPQAGIPAPTVYRAIQHEPVEIQPQLMEAALSDIIVMVPQPPLASQKPGVQVAALFAGGGVVVSNTPQVYPGCTAVPSTWTGTTYYIRANGSDSNPGTIGSPWQNFSHALGVGGSPGVMVAGDTLLVLDGGGSFPMREGGDLIIGGTHSGFVRVMPAPGNSPVLAGWTFIKDSSKILWQNLKWQALHDGADPLFQVLSDGSPNSADIVIYNGDFSSTDDTTALAWTALQWRTNARASGVLFENDSTYPAASQISCMSMTHSTVHNIGANGTAGAIGTGGPDIALASPDKVLIADNVLNINPTDGIDWSGTNIEISRNLIENFFSVCGPTTECNHNDGIQGQIGNCDDSISPFYCTWGPGVIDGNTVIELNMPAASLPLYQQCVFNGAQGINAFDEAWTGLTITNNIVITCATADIYFGPLYFSTIANNTAIQYPQAQGGSPGTNTGGINLLTYDYKRPAEPVSHDNSVKNNITSNLGADCPLNFSTNIFGPNLVLVNGSIIWCYPGSTPVTITAVGSYGPGSLTVLTGNANSTIFQSYDGVTPSWNLNMVLGGGNVANGAGTLPAPPYPNYPTFTPRTNPVNLGALGPGP